MSPPLDKFSFKVESCKNEKNVSGNEKQEQKIKNLVDNENEKSQKLTVGTENMQRLEIF